MPKNDPYQRLRDAYLLMLNDGKYLFHYQRIGAPAMENNWDDPATTPDPLACLVNFRTSVANGVFPDVNTLIFVANSFAKYLEAKGDLTLDQAFHLAPKQRAGHPLQSVAAHEKDDKFLSSMAAYRAEHPQATISDAASALYPASENDHAEYVERMVSYYHKQGWSKLEKQMEEGRIRLEPLEPYVPPE